jgi:hypothetical protein
MSLITCMVSLITCLELHHVSQSEFNRVGEDHVIVEFIAFVEVNHIGKGEFNHV